MCSLIYAKSMRATRYSGSLPKPNSLPDDMAFVSISTVLLSIFLSPLVFVSAILVKYAFASRRPKGFPPGPSGIPILGNVFQLPMNKAFLKSARPLILVRACQSNVLQIR